MTKLSKPICVTLDEEPWMVKTVQNDFLCSIRRKQAPMVELHLVIAVKPQFFKHLFLHQILTRYENCAIYDSQKRKQRWSIFDFVSSAAK